MKQSFFFILIMMIFLAGSKIFAQADISMATHWYNRANYNPASIARTDYIYLFFNARQQWVGVEGAPKVYNIQLSEYFREIQSAFGLSLVSDQTGATHAFNPMATYAYRIGFSRERSLSMGISGGVFSRFVDGSLFEAVSSNDATIQYDTQKTFKPDVNVGAEYLGTNFIFGLSTTHLLSAAKSDNLYLNTNHRYGYVIYKNNTPELYNYTFGVQVVNRYNVTIMEGSGSIRYKHQTGLAKGVRELFDIGMTYRSSRQLTLLFGVNVSPNLRVGYAYDHSFIDGYNHNGTHEVMVECRIASKASSSKLQCGDNEFWYH